MNLFCQAALTWLAQREEISLPSFPAVTEWNVGWKTGYLGKTIPSRIRSGRRCPRPGWTGAPGRAGSALRSIPTQPILALQFHDSPSPRNSILLLLRALNSPQWLWASHILQKSLGFFLLLDYSCPKFPPRTPNVLFQRYLQPFRNLSQNSAFRDRF